MNDEIIDILPSSNPEKYPNQKQFVIFINDYCYYVPFVEDETKNAIFLKTIIPSRELTKKRYTMKDIKLDEFEKEVLDFVENKRSDSVPNIEAEKARYKQIATDQVEKKKRINLRLLESDLTRMKAQAIREGLPYQTLISSIIHKYATGQLTSKD